MFTDVSEEIFKTNSDAVINFTVSTELVVTEFLTADLGKAYRSF
jgi:hypothetical protein